MDLVISIFVAFLILICILPVGIIVQRLVMCAVKNYLNVFKGMIDDEKRKKLEKFS